MGILHNEVGILDKEVGILDKEVGILDRDVGILDKEVGILHKEVGILDKEVGILDKEVGILHKEVGILHKEVGILHKEVGILHKEVGIHGNPSQGGGNPSQGGGNPSQGGQLFKVRKTYSASHPYFFFARALCGSRQKRTGKLGSLCFTQSPSFSFSFTGCCLLCWNFIDFPLFSTQDQPVFWSTGTLGKSVLMCCGVMADLDRISWFK